VDIAWFQAGHEDAPVGVPHHQPLARELGDDNVTVNAIAPGLTLTGASLGLLDNAAEYGVMRGALKRAAVSGDIVGAVLFLASPHATFVTGQTLVVDGGRQFL